MHIDIFNGGHITIVGERAWICIGQFFQLYKFMRLFYIKSLEDLCFWSLSFVSGPLAFLMYELISSSK